MQRNAGQSFFCHVICSDSYQKVAMSNPCFILFVTHQLWMLTLCCVVAPVVLSAHCPVHQHVLRSTIRQVSCQALPPPLHVIDRKGSSQHTQRTLGPRMSGKVSTSLFRTAMVLHHGWNHDSQFVSGIPDAWNGKVVVSGAPGVRGQYANDLVIGDWVLAQGYAFASTDKGNMGAVLGRRVAPGGRSASGTGGSPSWPSPPATLVTQRYGTDPSGCTWPASRTAATSRAGSSRTAPTSTTAGSTGRERCSAPRAQPVHLPADRTEEYPAYAATGDQPRTTR